MSSLTSKLDKIASSLESKGLLKEAEAVDIIANTLEAYEVEAAFQINNSPVVRYLNAILTNPQNATRAFKFIDDSGMYQNLVQLGDPNIGKSYAAYDKAKRAIEQDPTQISAVLPLIQEALNSFMAASKVVEEAVRRTTSGYNTAAPGQQPPAQQPPVQQQRPAAPINTPSMTFTSKKTAPANAPRKPLFNPGKKEE